MLVTYNLILYICNNITNFYCITVTFDSPIRNGSVCLFSLKNPSYPEWICPTESPVMCLDFSVQHPHLLVIGNFYEIYQYCVKYRHK